MLCNLTNEEDNSENCFVFNGNHYQIGNRVILWGEPKGFNGYIQKECVVKTIDDKTGKEKIKRIKGNRFSSRSILGKSHSINLIQQLVVHHSGADRKDPSVMYDVLYKQRGLSVQFAIEDDGRIYQFNDALDCCWHAGDHNAISIGAECCLFPFVDQDPNYYSEERRKVSGNLEHRIGVETIHGKDVRTYCMPQPQVDALAKLYAGCWIAVGKSRTTFYPQFLSPPVFPRIGGNLLKTVVPRAKEHIGLIGHLQITSNKPDPAGFPWYEFEVLVAKYFYEYSENYKAGKE